MKKTTKGAIAAGSAALLLAGGAGTMAAWNASTNLGGGSVTAGSMSITPSGTGVWTWTDGGTFNPGADKLVPGDSVTYTANFDYSLVGNNLTGTITPTLGGVTGDLLEYLEVTPATGTVTTVSTGTGTSSIATVITFKGDTADQNGAGANASLAEATVLLEQTISGS